MFQEFCLEVLQNVNMFSSKSHGPDNSIDRRSWKEGMALSLPLMCPLVRGFNFGNKMQSNGGSKLIGRINISSQFRLSSICGR